MSCNRTIQGPFAIIKSSKTHAPVAQLDRVLVSEAKGRGFDSRRAHHSSENKKAVVFMTHGFFIP